MAITGDLFKLIHLIPPPPLTSGGRSTKSWQVGGMHPTGMLSCYRPQRSCGQGNIFTPVCHYVHREGGLPQCMLGYHPPREQTPPGADYPSGADTPGSRHPPDQTPREQTPPPRDQTPPREADSSIWSTSGRYASYWNAFFFC